MSMRVKPRLYVPDFVSYARPFRPQFDIITTTKPYDIETMLTCDFLLLTGGADIDPTYYGQRANSKVGGWLDKDRDQKEYQMIEAAIAADIPTIGVCRGAQWQTIFAGGKLIQDVGNHMGGSHIIHTNSPEFENVMMPTAHHQMCDLHGVDHYLLAWTKGLSPRYLGEDDKELYPKGMSKEPEVFYIPALRALGIQGHPEYLGEVSTCNRYVRSLIHQVYGVM